MNRIVGGDTFGETTRERNHRVSLPISTLSLLVVLVGLVAEQATAQGWEYGKLTLGINPMSWHSETKNVEVLWRPEVWFDSLKSFMKQLGVTKIPANLGVNASEVFLLNELGRQGWELVTEAGDTRTPTYYFKRRR